MNNSETAKNGFKTFILTLVVSLIVFSAAYYMLSGSFKSVNIEENPQLSQKDSDTQKNILASTSGSSAFEDLSKQKMQVPQKVVLAGATSAESSQSTTPVPNTGTTEITFGLIFSALILGLGVYLIYLGPRRLALSNFEKDVLNDLD